MCKAFRKIQSLCPVAVKQQHKVAVRAKAVSVAQRAHLNGIRISKFLFHVPKTVCDHFPVPIWLAGTDDAPRSLPPHVAVIKKRVPEFIHRMGIGIKDWILLEFIHSRPGILSVLQKTQEIGCADPRRCAPVDTGTSNSSVKKRRFFGDLIKQPSPKMFFLGMGSNFIGVLHIHKGRTCILFKSGLHYIYVLCPEENEVSRRITGPVLFQAVGDAVFSCNFFKRTDVVVSNLDIPSLPSFSASCRCVWPCPC